MPREPLFGPPPSPWYPVALFVGVVFIGLGAAWFAAWMLMGLVAILSYP